MRLNDIQENPGATKRRVRIGRGIGSGVGKTGGRGGKGQTARSGVSIGGFEGGQMPLHRRLPKRGFNSINPKHYNELNIGDLEGAIAAGRIKSGEPLDLVKLVAAGVVRRPLDGLRLLGNGELTSKIAITVNHVSAGARAAIEKVGGSVTVIEQKVLPADEAKRAKTAAKRAKSAKPAAKGSE